MTTARPNTFLTNEQDDVLIFPACPACPRVWDLEGTADGGQEARKLEEDIRLIIRGEGRAGKGGLEARLGASSDADRRGCDLVK